MPRGQSKMSKRRVQARDNEQRAMELRKQGWTLQRIGNSLGVSAEAVRKMIRRKLEELAESTKEDTIAYRQLELERLDALWSALWPKRSSPGAVEKMVKIIHRRSQLLGLDAPQKREVTGGGGAPLIPPGLDLTKLSPEQLGALHEILAAARPTAEP
jgi:hypothetical protein